MVRLLALVGVATLSTAASLKWQLLPTNSAQRFRGLSPVSAETAWVAGTNGTVLRTTDGGETWESVGPPLSVEDVELQDRDVQAFSAEDAVILSIGEATDSRIYVTSNGGKSWIQSFTNEDSAAFYDCIAFDSPSHGMAMSDPVDGKFRLIETNNGGVSWDIVPSDSMPSALDGEFGFAASGTCLTTKSGRWYLASGGVNPGRIFSSPNGHDWVVNPSAIAGGGAAGVFSVQFRNTKQGIAVGGDYTVPNITANISSWSEDGGLTWHASDTFPGGYRSGSSWLPGICDTAIAVGPTGSDITFDNGKAWQAFDDGSFDSVECLPGRVCWASGEDGRVAKLVVA